ncbi:hypothetical protein FJTKL_02306 [Diaporthe vaccinii]|uniref:Uncharacterized protein n=1 Tax=Diaporthe vaccinii TaxID=105482 RepID=A0ABR4F3M1_9PEZI
MGRIKAGWGSRNTICPICGMDITCSQSLAVLNDYGTLQLRLSTPSQSVVLFFLRQSPRRHWKMSQHLTSAASSGIKHNGPPPPPPPKKEGLRHFVQENVGKVIVQPDGTEPNSRHLGDQRKSHFTSREVTTEHPSEHGETGSLSPSRAGVEGVVLTGVGRAHMNQGVMRVVDEARWNLHSQQDTNHDITIRRCHQENRHDGYDEGK